MGVSGAGKSTVAAALAARLGCPLLEGDDLHPARNIEKMRAGEPLTDEDRRDWLGAIAQRIESARAAGECLIVACSALKRRYRDVLRAAAPDLFFVYLAGSRSTLEQRVAGRHHPFMPRSLLDSQLAALEPLAPDEHGITCSIEESPAEIVDAVVAALSA